MAKEKKLDSIAEYIRKMAKKKGIPPAVWMRNAIQNASSYLRVTHVGKFTNPSIYYQCSVYDTSIMGCLESSIVSLMQLMKVSYRIGGLGKCWISRRCFSAFPAAQAA